MILETQKYISAEDFFFLLESPEYGERIFDLVEGVMLEIPNPSLGHGEVVMWLGMNIGRYVVENGLGRITGADAAFVLDRAADGRDTVRGIDFAFVSNKRLDGKFEANQSLTAPDLAVEVVSRSASAGDLQLKVRQLLAAGTDLVWIVYPESRTVVAHTADGALTHESGDILSGGDVLPGFEIRVGDIFPS